MTEKIYPFDRVLVLPGSPPDEAHVTPIENRWMTWIAAELVKLGIEAHALNFPTPWAPSYEEWKQLVEKFTVTPQTLLIGHSSGGAFLVRWLDERKMRVDKLILVAPAKVPEKEIDPRNVMYDFDLPKSGTDIASEIVLFTSNDFPHHVKARELYIEALHPRVIELPNRGHFLYYQMNNSVEFPELLKEILSGK